MARHIRSLDTLRGAAAIGVAVYHARFAFGAPTLLPHAYLFVDFFFVLSGFVMERAYGARLATRAQGAAFAQARLARLVPLYLFGTVLGAAVFVLHARLAGEPLPAAAWVRSLAANAAGLPDLLGAPIRSDGAAYPFLVPAWSIFWEGVVYALFAAWMLTGARAPFAVAVMMAGLLWALAAVHGGLDVGWRREDFAGGGLRAAAGFACGVAASRFAVEGRGLAQAWLWAGFAALALPAAYIAGLWPAGAWMEPLAAVVIFPLAVACCAGLRAPMLENRVGDAIGGASFACYMLHGLVIDVIYGLERKFAAATPYWLSWSLFALVLATVSLAAWRLFERPVQRRLLKRWAARGGRGWRRSAPPAAAPVG